MPGLGIALAGGDQASAGSVFLGLGVTAPDPGGLAEACGGYIAKNYDPINNNPLK